MRIPSSAFIPLSLLLIAGIVFFTLSFGPRKGVQDQRPLGGLKDFGRLPDFSLIERSGRTVSLSDLQDRTWIANFIYTSCKESCPQQSAEIARLQVDLAGWPQVQLVSITVDPERDQPEILARYADRYGADPNRWLFLTGDKTEIYRLAQEGFRLSAAPASSAEAPDIILHSSRFVLVDGQAHIRGYYHSNDAEDLRQLRKDIETLVTNDPLVGKGAA